MPDLARHPAPERSSKPAQCGFTLVEILMAVALLSIIVTVLYGAFDTIGRIVRRTEQTKDTYQLARLIMTRMRQDLSCALFSPSTTKKNFVFKGEDIQGENINGYDAGADALTFVTTGHVISGSDSPEGDLAEVSYYLDESNPGLLVRREDLSPDDELEKGGALDILGKNVVGLNFTYLDGREEQARRPGRSAEDGTEQDTTLEEKKAWKEKWDSEENPYLPRAVRIDLSLQNEEKQVEDFSTTVVLAMGSTATSMQPTVSPTPGIPGGPVLSPRERPTQPIPFGPRREGDRTGREGDRTGRGERREDFVPGRREGPPGRDGMRGPGRDGMRRPREDGSGPPPPDTPTIRRRPSDGTSGARPPAPGGRR